MGERQVRGHGRLVTHILISGVGHYSDDLGIDSAAPAEMPAQRAAGRPVVRGEALVDDGHLGRAFAVGFGEIAPEEQRRSQSAKVIRRDQVEEVIGLFAMRGVARHLDIGGEHLARQHGLGGGSDGLDARKAADALAQIGKERARGVLAVAAHGRIDGQHQDAIRAKAEVHSLQVAQRARQQARASRPAPRSRTTERLTCAATNARRAQGRANTPDGLPFKASSNSARDACSAGSRPYRRHANRDTATVKASTRASGAMRKTTSELPAESQAANRRVMASESSQPATPPIPASSRLSASNWPTMRARPAPSARRSAISERRRAARANNRLPILAQAITSSNATAAIRTTTGSRNCSRCQSTPWLPSVSFHRLAPGPIPGASLAASNCLPTACNSVSARTWETPGARRPRICIQDQPLRSRFSPMNSSVMDMGTCMSWRLCSAAPSKSGWLTPTI